MTDVTLYGRLAACAAAGSRRPDEVRRACDSRKAGYQPAAGCQPALQLQSDLPPISFEIVAECPHTHARAGLLHTPHGTIETPVFMPVGTQGTVKGLTQHDLGD